MDYTTNMLFNNMLEPIEEQLIGLIITGLIIWTGTTEDEIISYSILNSFSFLPEQPINVV